MAGFTTYDSIINALSVNGKGQRPFYQKNSVTAAAGTFASLWNIAGIPAAGTFGTAKTARTRDNTSTGAIPFTNAAGGNTMHLLSAGIGSTVAAGVFVLVDRLIEGPFDGTVTGANNYNAGTPITIPSRDINGAALGDGCMMFVENVANTNTTTPNLTVTYTNQAGTAAQSTGALALTAVGQHRFPTSTLFLPLATGDTGVRKLESYTLSATATSAQLNIVICRPLLFVPCMTAGGYTERDTVLQMANLPRLYDGSCLQWILLAAATTTGVASGSCTFADN